MKNLGTIVGILNALALLSVLGLFVYTRVLYKRPVITEAQERAKLEALAKKYEKPQQKAIVSLDPFTANLDPYVGDDGKPRTHYVSLGIALELSDDRELNKFNEVKPIILDRILQAMSKKKFEDLNQVQGRYLFRSQMVDIANEAMGKTVITDVFFSEFLLQ